MTEGLTAPTDLDSHRGDLFVVDQPGRIWLVRDGERLPEPFLDISDRIVDLSGDFEERGLLGLALHPDFASNGRLFIYYSAPLDEDAPADWNHTSHISELTVNDSRTAANPDSERVILTVDQPQANHNAGHITFGPDGYLYVPLGDGGGANDEGTGHPPEGNGQATDTPLGSILRIDVDGTEPYEVPPDNPFLGDDDVLDEIYAYGLRNPYGLSFDRATGDLYAADAGQGLYEAVYRIEPGRNYGWPIREGSQCFDPASPTDPPAECPATGPAGVPISHPVIEYERGEETGSVIVGAVAYRGEALPELQGSIILADWTTDVGSLSEPDGLAFAARPRGPIDPAAGPWPQLRELRIANPPEGAGDGRLSRFVLAVAQDHRGEAYLLTSRESGPAGETGEVWRLLARLPDGEPPDSPAQEPTPEPEEPDTPDGNEDGAPWPWIGLGAIVALFLALAGLLTARASSSRRSDRG